THSGAAAGPPSTFSASANSLIFFWSLPSPVGGRSPALGSALCARLGEGENNKTSHAAPSAAAKIRRLTRRMVTLGVFWPDPAGVSPHMRTGFGRHCGDNGCTGGAARPGRGPGAPLL